MRKSFISIFILCIGQIYAQTKTIDWKTILIKNEFKVTKDKKALPNNIVKQITDTITNIANPYEKWDASCHPNGLPRIKLNWVATDGNNWIVCYSIGGYSTKTIYELFAAKDNNETIQIPGWTYDKFKVFKRKFLSETLKLED